MRAILDRRHRALVHSDIDRSGDRDFSRGCVRSGNREDIISLGRSGICGSLVTAAGCAERDHEAGQCGGPEPLAPSPRNGKEC
jgi:hypothetical protein